MVFMLGEIAVLSIMLAALPPRGMCLFAIKKGKVRPRTGHDGPERE